MTIKEALKTLSENLTVSDGKLDLALINANLNGATTYIPATHERELDMVYLTLLLTSITLAEVREDDVSIKYAADLRGIASAYYRKWKMIDPFAPLKPTVKQKLIW
ncbi:MAG: hypothetical protein EOO42_01275 [Flavobacteriales bacterium]|nr:MAG: hypothetical protein EOO42_01275 [Flavobacteriales bacterium]